MVPRSRALVRRAGRKQHFATLGPGECSWVPICDVPDLPVFGAEVTARDDWNAWLLAAQHDDGTMCRRCRNPLLVAALALAEVEGLRARTATIADLEQQVRDLKAEVAHWTTVALGEVKRHGEFLRDHVTFRRARRVS